MYLDQYGNVRACCMNETHVLGNVTESSLTAIWRGAAARELRRAMERDDLTLGCDFCRWPVEEGRPDLAFSRWFEDFELEGAEPAWPRQLELSISNTCNLQCVMCNGEFSSSIRSRREGRPPLPAVYDAAVLDQLRPFVPHLRRVKFLGGEPFLAAETLQVMQILVEEGSAARCHVTTNGTQWTPRVERLLELLPVDVSVSLDAVEPATYEAIRVGADHATVRRNLERFREVAARRGTWLGLTFCLMTVNAREFAAFCRLGDELDVEVAVNTVTSPDQLSPYHQPPEVLAELVGALEADPSARSLGRNRPVWDAELDRLRRHLADRRAGRLVRGVDLTATTPVVVRAREDRPVPDPDRPRLASRPGFAGADHLTLDLDDIVTSTSGPVLGVEPEALCGRPGPELFTVFGERLAPIVGSEVESTVGDDVITRVALADGRVLRVLAVPALAADGRRAGTDAFVAWLAPETAR